MRRYTRQQQFKPVAKDINVINLYSKSSLAFGILCAALGAGQCAAAAESADSFPSKRISIIVAQGAGGSTDVDTRYYAERLSKILGQPVVVENKPGAGGLIGNTFVARAAADGYTLLSTSTSITITPSIRKCCALSIER